MLRIFKTEENRLTEIEAVEHGCWVSVTEPTHAEIDCLTDELGIDREFIRAALDEEETSRIEIEEYGTLVIVDLPLAEKQQEPKTRRRGVKGEQSGTVMYTTAPLAFIVSGNYVVTIATKENSVINEIEGGLVRNLNTHLRTRFVLQVLYRIATRYLQFLKQIDRISLTMQKMLHKSMKNKELFQLLELEKSLVYFSTSLKSNEVTLNKILRGRVLKLYEEDQDLLEDVLIEVGQAIEMCNIYSSILSGTMDAFASIISNNLNIVMKVLTSITILMAIPTMVSGFYGMNVEGLPFPVFWFPVAVSIVLVGIVAAWLAKKDMF